MSSGRTARSRMSANVGVSVDTPKRHGVCHRMMKRRNQRLWWTLIRDVSFTVSVVTTTESKGCCFLRGDGMSFKIEIEVLEIIRSAFVAKVFGLTPISSRVEHHFSPSPFLPVHSHQPTQPPPPPTKRTLQIAHNNRKIMCFGKRDSASASSFSSSSSDEPHARPIELPTIRRSAGTNRATANMPQQAPQRAAGRETIRFVEEVNITCDDQLNEEVIAHKTTTSSTVHNLSLFLKVATIASSIGQGLCNITSGTEKDGKSTTWDGALASRAMDNIRRSRGI
ncbi:hypothetical protein KCU64_g34, partial [Aureobasidium melanogenum]